MATSGNMYTSKYNAAKTSNGNQISIGHVFHWEIGKRDGYKVTINYHVRTYGSGTGPSSDTYWIMNNAWLCIKNGSTEIVSTTNSNRYPLNYNSVHRDNGAVTNLLSGSFTLDLSSAKTLTVTLTGAFYSTTANVNNNDDNKLVFSAFGPPSMSITDNGNNTIAVSFNPGTNLDGSTCTIKLKCGSNTAYSISKNKGDGSFNVSLDNIPGMSSVAASTLVCTISQANGTGTISSDYTSGNIKYYKKPSAPSKANITMACDKSKYVPTAIFTFGWTRPAAGNDSSPIKGYSIRVYKNGMAMPTPASSASDYLDRDGANNLTYAVSAEDYNMAIGDSLQIGLWAYTTNGKNTKLYSSETKSNAIVIVADKNYTAWARETPTSPWKKCEVMHAKISGSFKEVSNIHKLK